MEKELKGISSYVRLIIENAKKLKEEREKKENDQQAHR